MESVILEGKVSKSTGLLQLLKTQDWIGAKACEDITFSKPVLKLHDVGVIYPNTITVIQGQKGVHKSRLTEAICAAFISERPDLDFVGFRVSPLERFCVVYIDTERNQKDQLPFAIQRIKLSAGLQKTDQPLHLKAVSLIDFKRDERHQLLKEYLEEIRALYPDRHIVVVMDVLTDCVHIFQ